MNGSVETVADDIRFSRKERTPVGGRVGALCVLMLFCAAGLGLVRVWLPEQVVQMDVAQEAVQVSGDVPSPGMYLVSPPLRVHVALEAAGIDDLSGMPDAVVEPGTRIVVEGRSYRLESMERPLVVGLPISLNTADQTTLESIPGIGPSKASAIIEERASGGHFQSVEDLARVKGIGPSTVEAMRPFVTVEDLILEEGE